MAATTAIEVTIEVPDSRIRDMLCCAFEGGSNYWYDDLAPVYPPGFTRGDFKEGGKAQPRDAQGREDYFHWCQLLPLMDGGAVTFRDKEGGKEYRLDRAKIKAGLLAFRDQCPRHFAVMMADDGDADTGDAFLQCCTFGEVIYG